MTRRLHDDDYEDDCVLCGTIDVLTDGLCLGCQQQQPAHPDDAPPAPPAPALRAHGACTMCGAEHNRTSEFCARCENWTLTGKDTPL